MDYVRIAIDEVLCDKKEVNDYVDLMNGISWKCQNGGYEQGWRNTIMVDFTVATFMLGLDPIEMLELFDGNGMICEFMDDEHPSDRVHRVMSYDKDFSWEWMISPGDFVIIGQMHANDLDKVKFEIA